MGFTHEEHIISIYLKTLSIEKTARLCSCSVDEVVSVLEDYIFERDDTK